MYKIAQIAAELDVSVATLRSWERRYRVVTPERTEGGHRRYTDADVDRLRVFAQVTRRRRAGETAELLQMMDRH